jgi:hypothetical protein
VAKRRDDRRRDGAGMYATAEGIGNLGVINDEMVIAKPTFW